MKIGNSTARKRGSDISGCGPDRERQRQQQRDDDVGAVRRRQPPHDPHGGRDREHEECRTASGCAPRPGTGRRRPRRSTPASRDPDSSWRAPSNAATAPSQTPPNGPANDAEPASWRSGRRSASPSRQAEVERVRGEAGGAEREPGRAPAPAAQALLVPPEERQRHEQHDARAAGRRAARRRGARPAPSGRSGRHRTRPPRQQEQALRVGRAEPERTPGTARAAAASGRATRRPSSSAMRRCSRYERAEEGRERDRVRAHQQRAGRAAAQRTQPRARAAGRAGRTRRVRAAVAGVGDVAGTRPRPSGRAAPGPGRPRRRADASAPARRTCARCVCREAALGGAERERGEHGDAGDRGSARARTAPTRRAASRRSISAGRGYSLVCHAGRRFPIAASFVSDHRNAHHGGQRRWSSRSLSSPSSWTARITRRGRSSAARCRAAAVARREHAPAARAAARLRRDHRDRPGARARQFAAVKRVATGCSPRRAVLGLVVGFAARQTLANADRGHPARDHAADPDRRPRDVRGADRRRSRTSA